MKKHLTKSQKQRRKNALQRLRLMNLKKAVQVFLVKTLLASLILSLIACSSNKQVITQIKTERITIAKELLELEELKKPIIKNESDIINAYLDLYNHYKQCEYNINAIKKINDLPK